MTHLIFGGGASGKSEYAESVALELAKENENGRLYYVATMMAYGESGAYRVKRHRKLRAGKGFETVEIPRDIGALVEQLKDDKSATLLIEDLSNLLANEMFVDEEIRNPVTKIVSELKSLADVFGNVIFVSNNIFEDGADYDDASVKFIQYLGEVNTGLAAFCDEVTEVIVGIPVKLK